MSEVEGAVTGMDPGAVVGAKYTRNNPYLATVTQNYLLTSSESDKETRHLAFALEEGMTYAPGDAIGVLPENRAVDVAEVLKALGFSGEERVLDHYKVEISFEEALRTRLSIGKLTRGSIGLYAKLAAAAAVGGKGHEALKALCGPENKAHAEEYCWGREFIDLVTDFPGAISGAQELFHVLPRLVPRLYSIASSQRVHHGVAETTVRVVRYETHGRSRMGVASGQLGERTQVGSALPVFLHENHNFRLPEDDSTPVIMVGPGTGVAPFRAFLEERRARGASGDNWLFFGDQHEASDFLYRDDLQAMLAGGVLTRLDTAFSRDQAKKIYVQDRMAEQAKRLYAWLERGAYFYVCGDATQMAKSVEQALLGAIAEGAQCAPEQAREYLAAMKKQGHYQRDVY
ncbi:MAG TPA: oxidoreductase [Acidobacteriaceae bacterium]|nr:oxidoreductase [Acidobacteriaceae bacterium]